MKKSKIKKCVKDMIVKYYGEKGYTATADAMLREMSYRLDILYHKEIHRAKKKQFSVHLQFNSENRR